ncbi:hypothetical protein IE53DRAFT_368078 [Violaceomyces palustris]|uniref:Uncharacterized protein n=1 Tax=Violaceomyces palustris TaxID=1673888 RepID=A0ACD0NZU5_9BASI|nr:hypothetical protein IE53DRAFT_368078 [Violaceomyces palustris]
MLPLLPRNACRLLPRHLPPSPFHLFRGQSKSQIGILPLPTTVRPKSTISILKPDRESLERVREVPTPVLFLSSQKWTGQADTQRLLDFASRLSKNGYESILLELDPDLDLASVKDSAELMQIFEDDIRKTLKESPNGLPFPPILISSGPEALIAQTYASSNPLTALQLIDPPISNKRLHGDAPRLLPTPLNEFDFEIKFPVRVVWTAQEIQRQAEAAVPWYEVHRIEYEREEEAGESLDRIVWKDLHEGPEDTIRWLEEECGVAADGRDGSSLASDDAELFDEGGEHGDDEVAWSDFTEEDLEGTNQVGLGGSSSSSSTTTEEGSSTRGLPEWFLEGSYSFQPGNKKHPLLLDEKDLSERFIRGSGPGGQAINKLSTNVELIHKPTGLRLTCQETRSRELNREFARRRMSRELERLLKPSGGSVIETKWDKERRKKMNKKKKQKRKLREKV